MLNIKYIEAERLFGVFSACRGDAEVMIMDLRPAKDFAKRHIVHAFCVRVSANGAALLDYSKASYDNQHWGEAAWWDRCCLLYGPEGLKKDHPVAQYLEKEGRARSVEIYRGGFAAFAERFPFLTTAGVRTQRDRVYPSLVASPYLYLGNWGHAETQERLKELGVSAILTIHNNPERLKPGPEIKRHLRVQMADVESEDIGASLRPAHDFIEAARAEGRSVLVHCGAGVSRSAALCIGHLMLRHGWTAQAALDAVKARRSAVQPNDGFWRALCRLEEEIGLSPGAKRSDPAAFSGVHGLDWNYAEEAAGREREQERTAAKPAFIPEGRREEERKEEGRQRRSRSRSRSRDRRRRSRSRSRSRDRDRRRRSRSRSQDRKRRPDRSASPRRDRNRRSRSRSRSPRRERAREEKGRGGGGGGDGGGAGPVLEMWKAGKRLGKLVLDLGRPSQECIFGRLPSCGVPLEHMSVSRQHARLVADGTGRLWLTDLGSAHGTQVDGVWVRPKEPKEVKVGSSFRFGASTREFKVAAMPQIQQQK